MNDEQFAIAKNDLLLSLYDGKEVNNSAAEYILAWESLEKSPSDYISSQLKNTAESIIKISFDTAPVGEEDYKDAFDEKDKAEGPGYLLSTKRTHGDPTNHVWADGLFSAKNISHQAAMWPTYATEGGSTYKAHHFPYHQTVHPLRRNNAVTDKPNFVELLKAYVLGGHGEEEKEFEKAYVQHLIDKKSPLHFGSTSKDKFDKKTQKLLGQLDVNGTVGNHQMDFYERDFLRWLSENRDKEIQLEKQGVNSKEIEKIMRNQHFDERADDWTSNKAIVDENGVEHPYKLGLDGYMYGLEWFTPEERTAIMQHLYDEEGGVDNHDTITLPSGEKIPSARLNYNNILRRTPDMNYMTRGQGFFGRNSSYRMESNEDDFESGEGMFNQMALGELAHQPTSLKESFSHYILEEINNKYAKEIQSAEIPDLEYLPRLGLHKKNPQEDYTIKELSRASERHYKDREINSPLDTRLPIEDILFLSGFNPKTRKPMVNHPIFGKMDGPIIPLEKIEQIEDEAKVKGTLPSQAKEIRNDRSFLTSPHGPHVDEESPEIWSEGNGFRYGPSKFWGKMYAVHGGQGMTFSTWMELNHSVSHDPERSTMFEIDSNRGSGQSHLKLNDNNKSLGYHFAPEETVPIGVYDTTQKRFVKDFPSPTIQNILSPVNASKKILSEKNNFTEHKSSLNPVYEYMMRHITPAEKKKLKSHNPHMQVNMSQRPLGKLHPDTTYGESPSDGNMLLRSMQAHMFNTFLGRGDHPNQPAKKSVASLNDLLSGNLAVSGGEGLEDFMDFMGWGVKKITGSNVKNITKKDRFPLSVFNSISKIINSNSPKDVVEYLNNTDASKNNHNYMAIKNKLGIGAHDNLNIEEVKTWFKNYGSDYHKNKIKNAEEKNLKNYSSITSSDSLRQSIKEINEKLESGNLSIDDIKDLKSELERDTSKLLTTDAEVMEEVLSHGGMLPALQQEESVRETVEKINEELMNPNLSIDDVKSLRSELRSNSAKLIELQNKSKEKAIGKGTNHWKIQANQTLELLKNHRRLVAEVARDHIIPKYLEHDENAFSVDDPQQFIWNTQRAFSDAERYLHSTSRHGLSASTYGTTRTTKKNKTLQNKEHKNIASHIDKNGFEVNGNMSVDEVIDGLNVKKTPQMKEYVRSLIEESNKREVPLQVSTIKNLLLGDKTIQLADMSNELLQRNEEIMNISPEDASDDDIFHQDLHNEGLYSAIDNAQRAVNSKDGNWKAHFIHRMPSMVKQIMDPSQFSSSLQAYGLEMLSMAGPSPSAKFDPHNALGAGKGVKRISRKTKNAFDTIIFRDESNIKEDDGEPQTVKSAGMTRAPIGEVSPTNVSLYSTFNSGQIHNGYLAYPSLGAEFDSEGEIYVGPHAQPGMMHSVPEELMKIAHSPEAVTQVLQNAPPPESLETPQSGVNPDTYNSPSDEFTSLTLSEVTDYINSLIDPDLLLIKSEEGDWVPPIRPMHRIFSLTNMEHLRGFSGSWAVSKWYDGKRIIIIKKDSNATAYDENNKKVGLKKKFKDNINKINDKNYVIDAILGEDEIQVIDIINYDDNNVADMLLFERMKILRGQFDSYENVIVPGPHNTRMTDDEGLENIVEEFKKEHETLLLRDNKSTYMKGERRHPKWLLLREGKDFNFIILDRRGEGPYTYQLGAGPINNASVIGNRAITLENKDYMDIGTARGQQKLFKVGAIVRAKITGINKKLRGGRDVFNVHVQEITGEGEGEGPASTESLDLLTKSFSPILIPHDIDLEGDQIKVILKDIDTVNYTVENIGDKWFLQSATTDLGDLYKSNYSLNLADSLQPYWGPLASLMVQGYLQKLEMDEKHPPSRKRQENQSAGVLDADDEKRLLKPSTKKAAEIFSRAVDILTKEKMTWTGPRGLGIDMATPVESPGGPTKLTEDYNLPDYDGKKRYDDDYEEEETKKPINHMELNTNEGEALVFDKNKDEVTISQK